MLVQIDNYSYANCEVPEIFPISMIFLQLELITVFSELKLVFVSTEYCIDIG